ncbi:MAG: FtsX-like permease family protein [Acetobacteraceae bacterium]|nr:FtsX-like permease family protein [Acetobacteraceae bacterium]
MRPDCPDRRRAGRGGGGGLIAWTFARRELRAGVRGLRIVLACLALGVAAIAAVGSLREGIARGLASEGRRILGGDLEIQSGAQPLPDALRNWLAARGATLSDIVTMRSMLVAENGERQLVELKAVDPRYPLVGHAELQYGALPSELAERAGMPGLVADPLVLDRLGVKPGAQLRLGRATFELRGALLREPDRVAGPAIFGPRVMIAAAALPATELVQPGSLLNYDLRAILPAGTDPAATASALRAAFPDTGWRIRLAGDAAPGVGRFVDQTSLFLTLVGLTALLVGGIGVATGVRAWLEARARSIAILRCLGADSRLIFAVFLIQVMALSLAGILLGVAGGAALTAAGVTVFGDALPVPPQMGLYAKPLLLAASYGLLTAGAFALWPLARAAQIPGAALFRDALLPGKLRSRPKLLLANAALAMLLVALTVATAPERGFASWFCGGAFLTLVLFWLGGALLTIASRHGPHLRAPWARLGLANLHRPGSATGLMLVSLGLGLSTLAAVALIQGNIRAQVLEQLPAAAPTFFFIDIQNDQLARFKQVLAVQPGVEKIDEVPSLRARIVSVDGVPADQVRATPDSQWALRGDRGLTYAATPPEGSRIVAGSWWPADYAGPPLVSFDAALARGWGVGIGSVIRVNVLGRDIDLKIASLRDVAWRTLGINFTMVASPGLLERAPHTHIATVRTEPSSEGAILRAVTDALPNVSGIRVADVLGAVADLVGKIAAALAATGSITLAAGALVLAGAVAAGQRRRMAEAVVLKTLGATRRQIRAAWLVEFGLIGATAGVLAAFVGTAASWGVVRYVMRADWVFLPDVLAATIGACILLMLGFGYVGTAAALRARPAGFLRNE